MVFRGVYIGDKQQFDTQECLRLAVMGGGEAHPTRGMALNIETEWVNRVFMLAFDLEKIIEAQTHYCNVLIVFATPEPLRLSGIHSFRS